MRLPITIATILAVALFLGGCWGGPKTSPPTTQPPTKQTREEAWRVPEELAVYDIARITSTEQILPLEKPIDTSDWNVYRDEECGFEIRYPDNWKTEIWHSSTECMPDGDRKFALISYAYDKEVAQKIGEVEIGYIMVSLFPKKKVLQGKAPAGFIYYGDKLIRASGVINNNKVHALYGRELEENITLYLENNGYIYTLGTNLINIGISKKVQIDPNEMRNILHTFRFLNGGGK